MRRAAYTRLKRTLTTVLVLSLSSTVLYVYFHTGLFSIREYRILGAPEGYVEELDRGARLIAENRIGYLLPGNRVVSFHDNELKMLVLETLPNSKKISVYPSGLHTLTIRIEPHVPLFAVSETHAISREGIVYKEIIPLDAFPQLEVATSSSVHPRVLRSVADLVEKIDSVLYDVRFVAVDEHNDIRLYDQSKSGAVIVSNKADMDLVWSNLLSAIDTDPLKASLATKKDRLEYIDTRFGNKVFYKFTNGTNPDIIPPHDTTTASSTSLQ